MAHEGGRELPRAEVASPASCGLCRVPRLTLNSRRRGAVFQQTPPDLDRGVPAGNAPSSYARIHGKLLHSFCCRMPWTHKREHRRPKTVIRLARTRHRANTRGVFALIAIPTAG